MKTFKEHVFMKSTTEGDEDLKPRATKTICTIGHQNKSKEKVKELMKKGMDICRINMDIF
jgi:hypothetical protein